MRLLGVPKPSSRILRHLQCLAVLVTAFAASVVMPIVITAMWMPVGFEYGIYRTARHAGGVSLLCIKAFDTLPYILLNTMAGVLIGLLGLHRPVRLALLFGVVTYITPMWFAPKVWCNDALYQWVRSDPRSWNVASDQMA